MLASLSFQTNATAGSSSSKQCQAQAKEDPGSHYLFYLYASRMREFEGKDRKMKET
jgi:hypothetical protein